MAMPLPFANNSIAIGGHATILFGIRKPSFMSFSKAFFGSAYSHFPLVFFVRVLSQHRQHIGMTH
jgi:hypothetical protein